MRAAGELRLDVVEGCRRLLVSLDDVRIDFILCPGTLMTALARSVSSTVHDALVRVLVVALILEKRQRVTSGLVRVPLPVKQGSVVMLRSVLVVSLSTSLSLSFSPFNSCARSVE
jgi:hypothetical protein